MTWLGCNPQISSTQVEHPTAMHSRRQLWERLNDWPWKFTAYPTDTVSMALRQVPGKLPRSWPEKKSLQKDKNGRIQVTEERSPKLRQNHDSSSGYKTRKAFWFQSVKWPPCWPSGGYLPWVQQTWVRFTLVVDLIPGQVIPVPSKWVLLWLPC